MREFKFKIKRRPGGEAWVVWEGDPIKDSEPGEFHVIEKSAYDEARADLKTAVKFLREGKARFTPNTTNSLVDDFLERMKGLE